MTELVFHERLLYSWFVVAVVTFVVLMRLPAPYGRYSTARWGPTLGARTGWVFMEAPASVLFLGWYLLSSNLTTVSLVFLLMWQVHYVQRAFHYPFTLDPHARPVPVLIVCMGILFNSVNTYLNARYLFEFSPVYELDWLTEPRFLAGSMLFAVGYFVNRHADRSLARERGRSGGRYCRMDGGLFRYVCCPNYLGEILIWSGWAVTTWSLAGLSFAVWTAANLTPRARAHLHWCRRQFEDYPEDRKALFPLVW